MKNIIALVLIGILVFGSLPIPAYAANGSVDSISATYTDGSSGSLGTLAYSGTVADIDTTKAIAILILKGEGNSAQLLLMDTCSVRNDKSFSSSISVKLTEAGTYTIQASDYEGGAFATATFIVRSSATQTTPPPIPQSTPITEPTKVIKKEPVIVIKDTVANENVPDTKVDSDIKEIKEGVLTAEEQARVDAGESVAVYLEVKDIKESVSKEDKARIEEALGEETIGLYLDIKLIKQIGEDKAQEVSKTNEKLKISVKIPEELLIAEEEKIRIYKMIKIHEGVVTVLDGAFNKETGLFTFETDEFSTYALVYSDVKRSIQWSQLYEKMYLGEKKKFIFDAIGYDVNNIVWKTSKKDIAVVAKNKGKTMATVTAKSVGTDTLYLKSEDNKLLKLTITVMDLKAEEEIPIRPTVTEDNTYIVKTGDTLWWIAKKYKITVKAIVDKNNIKNQNQIVVGQRLKIVTDK